jgi:AraC-like DNA-binding protein/mannose-6-phosphate isomerase-like protein (cupin superfamily)
MNSDTISAIMEYSNSYASKLFRRFLDNASSSNEELQYFQRIKDSLPNVAESFQEFSALLPQMNGEPLAYSLFQPGSISDVFINCHTSQMNHWTHSNEFFEIIYVDHGNIVDWIDGVEVHLSAGELCIHNPNALHKIEKMNEGEDLVINILLPREIFKRSFYSLLMENEELNKFFNNYLASSDTNPNYMAFHGTTRRVDTIIELLVEEFLRGEAASRFVMESTLVVLFGELMRNYHSSPFIQELIAFITDHMTDVSMELAATHFGYHKNYFPSVVKSKTNHTFLELVTDIRLQKACNLLLLTKDSIEEISAAIGYKSTASFYSKFYARYKMTPKDYRKRH